MPDYVYKAADGSGTIIKGVRFANTEGELANYFKRDGLFLLEYEERHSHQVLAALKTLEFGGVSRQLLVEFSSSMAVMLKAGIPVLKALEEFYEDCESRHFKSVLGLLIDKIQEGQTLSEAMSRKPKDFPVLYCNVIEIGESSGRLDEVFTDLARHYKRIDDLVKNVRKAMYYPAFILVTLFLAAYVFLTMVFPSLFGLLKDFDVPLPAVTLIVMRISDLLKEFSIPIFGSILAVISLILFLRRKPATRYYLDWIELRLPYLRSVLIQLHLAFFMRYFSMLLAGGMNILRAMELSTDSINNLVIKRLMVNAREMVSEGTLLSDSLRPVRYFPHMVLRMVTVGEHSGDLPGQMEYIADYYNEVLQRRVSFALSLLEPVILIMLAAIALALVMSVLLPLYNLVSAVSNGAGSGGGM